MQESLSKGRNVIFYFLGNCSELCAEGRGIIQTAGLGQIGASGALDVGGVANSEFQDLFLNPRSHCWHSNKGNCLGMVKRVEIQGRQQWDFFCNHDFVCQWC